MARTIILDSTPLALFLQKRDYRQAEECRAWIRRHLAAGDHLIVPAIAEYEVRRDRRHIKCPPSLTICGSGRVGEGLMPGFPVNQDCLSGETIEAGSHTTGPDTGAADCSATPAFQYKILLQLTGDPCATPQHNSQQ